MTTAYLAASTEAPCERCGSRQCVMVGASRVRLHAGPECAVAMEQQEETPVERKRWMDWTEEAKRCRGWLQVIANNKSMDAAELIGFAIRALEGDAAPGHGSADVPQPCAVHP